MKIARALSRIRHNKYFKLKNSFVFLIALILLSVTTSLFVFTNKTNEARAAGNTYYVDATDGLDTNDGLTPETAWQTVTKVNSASYLAGDTILFQRGESWSGTAIAPPRTSLTYGSYGTGNLPKLNSGYSHWRSSITLNDLWLNSVAHSVGTGLIINRCTISSTTKSGVTLTSGSATVNNSVLASSLWQGVQTSGTGTVAISNSIVIANRLGAFSAGGAAITYDHCLISGNGTSVGNNIGTATDGGNNIVGEMPYTISPKTVESPIFVITMDEENSDGYWDAMRAMARENDIHLTVFFVKNPPNIPKTEDFWKSELEAFAAAGHEIGDHGWSHSSLIATQAFDVSTTNADPSININTTTKTLTLTTTTPGNNVSITWASESKSITDLKTAVSGKGWTITNKSSIHNPLQLKALADSGGEQTVFPYTANLNTSAYLSSEFGDCFNWIVSNIGVTPTTGATPIGSAYADATVKAYYKDTLGLLGVRGTGTSTSDNLSSLAIYDDRIIGGSPVSESESDIRTWARWQTVQAGENGLNKVFLTHGNPVDFSAEEFGWFVDEVKNSGGQWKTFGEFISSIRTSHTTADGYTYTKTYPDISNYGLKYNSPAIDTGISTGQTVDVLGNPIYGTPDIGAYEYQPPHTMVTNKIDIGAGARVYGNGKFRDKNTITASEADLSITPTSGFVAGVYTAWLDIANISWSNTGTHHKSWQESNAIAGLTNTIHTVGDLEANKYYKVTVDSTANNLTGSSCSTIDGTYVCKSNSSGKITFTYTGTYSTHTFDVEEGDNSGPTISNISSSSSSNSATISWTTDESSTSRVDYGFTTNYVSTVEDTNMVTDHSVGLTNLASCTQYHYRVYSKDAYGNDRFSTDNTFTTEGCSTPSDDSSSGSDESSSSTGSWRYFSTASAASSQQTPTTEGIPTIGTMDEEIRFDASNLFPGKSINKYVWDFGDGDSDEGKIVTHKYTAPGRYTVKVTGFSTDGNEYVYETTIDINPKEPVITNIKPTDDTDLIIEGTGYQGDTIYLSIHSTPMELESSVDDTGYWSYTIAQASETLGEGTHTVSAIDSFKLADNTELKSQPTDDTKFKVSVEDGKLKVEMEKTSRWRIAFYVLGGIIVLGLVVYAVRRKGRR